MIRQNFSFRNLQNWERDKVGTSKAKFLLSPILLSVRKAYSYLHRFLVGTNFCKGSSGYILKKKEALNFSCYKCNFLAKEKKNATNFHVLPLLAMLFFPSLASASEATTMPFLQMQSFSCRFYYYAFAAIATAIFTSAVKNYHCISCIENSASAARHTSDLDTQRSVVLHKRNFLPA